ncbi:MAG: nucleotidyltransferase family protein [Firmicutes bacterium]|nr:nucleotidyltransferase family protein [Bacillota bacterium]
MKFAAVVPAAGLSSRMGVFKPLMDLNGKPMICRTLDSLRAAGCGTICVVTGHRAEELEAAAAAKDVCFLRNENYASTGMLESVQLGLAELLAEPAETVFFILPGDVPLVSRQTMEALKTEAEKGGSFALRPSYNGKAGHPVLLDRTMALALLSYRGEDGLRGFLRKAAEIQPEIVRVIACEDPGILADADTPEDYQAVLASEPR